MAGPDRITANLPAISFDATEAFYTALGFETGFKDSGWMILTRRLLEIEFFAYPDLDPYASSFSACVRLPIWMRCSKPGRAPAFRYLASPD